jgi:hypothetical protein
MNLDYGWQKPYAAAVLETDDGRLAQRIEEAEGAIQTRVNELNADHRGMPQERMAIEFALNCLAILRKEVTGPRRRSA